MSYSGLEAISLPGQGGHFWQYTFNILLCKTDLYNTTARCLSPNKSSDIIEALTKHAREDREDVLHAEIFFLSLQILRC